MNYEPLQTNKNADIYIVSVPTESAREETALLNPDPKIKQLELITLPQEAIVQTQSHNTLSVPITRQESGTLKTALAISATTSSNSEDKEIVNSFHKKALVSPPAAPKQTEMGSPAKKTQEHRAQKLNLSIEDISGFHPGVGMDRREGNNSIAGSIQKLKAFFGKEKSIPSIDLDFSIGDDEMMSQHKLDQFELLNRNLNYWETEEEKIVRTKTRDRRSIRTPSAKRKDSSATTPRTPHMNFWKKTKNVIIQKAKETFVFKPDGKFKISWDLMGMFFILYEVLMIPLRISFDFESSGITVIELMIDIFFISDILMTFNTGYYSRGHLVVNRKQIAVNYMKAWFWMDLFASFPYARFIQTDDDDDGSGNSSLIRQSTRIIKIIRFFRFVRVIRLLRVFKLKSIFGKLDNFISLSPALNAITGFLRLACIILFIAHWIACFWHMIGDLEFGSEYETWITRQQLQDQSWSSKYLASIYWAITTMITVGYGDIVPITDIERIYTLFTMLLASGVFAYSMNSINALLTGIDAERQEFKETIVWVKRYMRKMKLDPATRAKVTKYLEYTLIEANHRKDDEARLLSLLSDSLKDEVVKKINEGVLNTCESLRKMLKRNFTDNFIVEMTYFFNERVYSPGEKIFSEGADEELCLYMINSGPVKTVLSSSRELVLQTYKRGDYFGEVEFFTGMNRIWNAKAGDDFVSLFSLKRKDFLGLIGDYSRDYSRDKEKFFQLKEKISLYRDFSGLDLKCNFCKRSPHLPLECTVMHYVIDRTRFLKEQIQENARFRRSFKRKTLVKTQGKNLQQLEICALKIQANLTKEIEALENEEPSFDFHRSDTFKFEDFTHKKTNEFTSTIREIDLGIRSISDVVDSEEGKKNEAKIMKYRQMTRRLRKNATLEAGFDAVYSYKEYFPHNNIENVLKKVNEKPLQNMKIKRMKVLRRFVQFSLAFKKPKVPVVKINPPQTPSFPHSQRGNNPVSLMPMSMHSQSHFDLRRIPEDVELDTSRNSIMIAEEQVVFNQKENKQNDEFTKMMNIKMMPEFSKENTSSSGESSDQGADQARSGKGMSEEFIEHKLQSYPELGENIEVKEEVSNMLDLMISKYGSKYIQEILSLKECKD